MRRRRPIRAPRPAAPSRPLQRRLKGDLDTILLKALRKEPHQRYLSVEAFADDLRRFLEGKPVAARRPTLAYRTRKFLRRHWLPAAAAAALVLTLVVGSAALAVQARRLEQERDKSDAHRRLPDRAVHRGRSEPLARQLGDRPRDSRRGREED